MTVLQTSGHDAVHSGATSNACTCKTTAARHMTCRLIQIRHAHLLVGVLIQRQHDKTI